MLTAASDFSGVVDDLGLPLIVMLRDAHDGSSVWSRSGGGTRVGEQVADTRVTLSSDASDPALECVPFIEDMAARYAEADIVLGQLLAHPVGPAER